VVSPRYPRFAAFGNTPLSATLLSPKRQHLRFLLDSRITGFEGHWMTFGGVQMMVLLLLVSIVLFSDKAPR